MHAINNKAWLIQKGSQAFFMTFFVEKLVDINKLSIFALPFKSHLVVSDVKV
jgi:hypothetical protein